MDCARCGLTMRWSGPWELGRGAPRARGRLSRPRRFLGLYRGPLNADVRPAMQSKRVLRTDIDRRLTSAYQEIMWLARRPGVTPSMARAWYTHIVAGRLQRSLRSFNGLVSAKAAAASSSAALVLEHPGRIQSSLTRLITRHLKLPRPDPNEFVRLVRRLEKVCIVTFRENYDARCHNGNYRAAGIVLRQWSSLAPEQRRKLWSRMLRGRVANCTEFLGPVSRRV